MIYLKAGDLSVQKVIVQMFLNLVSLLDMEGTESRTMCIARQVFCH